MSFVVVAFTTRPAWGLKIRLCMMHQSSRKTPQAAMIQSHAVHEVYQNRSSYWAAASYVRAQSYAGFRAGLKTKTATHFFVSDLHLVPQDDTS